VSYCTSDGDDVEPEFSSMPLGFKIVFFLVGVELVFVIGVMIWGK